MTARELIATAALAGRIIALHVAVQCCGLRRVRGWLGYRIAPVPAPGDDEAQIVVLWRMRVNRIKRRLPRSRMHDGAHSSSAAAARRRRRRGGAVPVKES